MPCVEKLLMCVPMVPGKKYLFHFNFNGFVKFYVMGLDEAVDDLKRKEIYKLFLIPFN